LVELVRPLIESRLGGPLDAARLARVRQGMAGLKARAETLEQLAENAMFYVRPRPIPVDDKAAKLLGADSRAWLAGLATELQEGAWDAEVLEAAVRRFAEAHTLKLGQIAQPLRAALTGSTISPGIFEVMVVLGREEALARIDDAACRDR
jgi:glutamyl-tRNA synthetase